MTTTHPSKHNISECIDAIKLGEDIVLLRLLSETANTLHIIKRGVVYKLTREILDADPYWTRHFVRTQLERYGVNETLINSIIGHEKGRQEALGQFSSVSKSKIKSVSGIFEQVADSIGLKASDNNHQLLNNFRGNHHA